MPKDETHTEVTDLALDETTRKEVDKTVAHGGILIYFAVDLMAWRHPVPEGETCAFLNQKLEEISAKLMYLHEHYELRPKRMARTQTDLPTL